MNASSAISDTICTNSLLEHELAFGYQVTGDGRSVGHRGNLSEGVIYVHEDTNGPVVMGESILKPTCAAPAIGALHGARCVHLMR